MIVAKINSCKFWSKGNHVPTNGIKVTSFEFKTHSISTGGRFLAFVPSAPSEFCDMGEPPLMDLNFGDCRRD